MRFKTVAALLIAMLCVASTALVAQAAKTKYKTNVTISHTGDAYGSTFKGKVKSQKKACKKNRKVTVKRVRSGSDQKIGSTKSNKKGKWRVDTAPAQNGKYYAVAKKKSKNNYVCKKGKSPKITVN